MACTVCPVCSDQAGGVLGGYVQSAQYVLCVQIKQEEFLEGVCSLHSVSCVKIMQEWF